MPDLPRAKKEKITFPSDDARTAPRGDYGGGTPSGPPAAQPSHSTKEEGIPVYIRKRRAQFGAPQ